jgi:hypothetical protein
MPASPGYRKGGTWDQTVSEYAGRFVIDCEGYAASGQSVMTVKPLPPATAARVRAWRTSREQFLDALTASPVIGIKTRGMRNVAALKSDAMEAKAFASGMTKELTRVKIGKRRMVGEPVEREGLDNYRPGEGPSSKGRASGGPKVKAENKKLTAILAGLRHNGSGMLRRQDWAKDYLAKMDPAKSEKELQRATRGWVPPATAKSVPSAWMDQIAGWHAYLRELHEKHKRQYAATAKAYKPMLSASFAADARRLQSGNAEDVGKAVGALLKALEACK